MMRLDGDARAPEHLRGGVVALTVFDDGTGSALVACGAFTTACVVCSFLCQRMASAGEFGTRLECATCKYYAGSRLLYGQQ